MQNRMIKVLACVFTLLSMSMAAAAFLLDPPYHIYPLGYIPTKNPTFSWQSVANADKYIFELRDKETLQIIYRNDALVTNSLILPTNVSLQYNRAYQWRVMALNQLGFSDWTIFRGFVPYDPAFVPSALDPFAYVSELSPQFTWTSVNGADHYHLILVDRDFAYTVYENNLLYGNSTTLPASIKLQYNHVYIWNIRAVSATGESSYWSPPRGFKTYDPNFVPITQSPFSYVGGNRPVFKWNSVAGASSYRIQIIDKDVEQVILDKKNVSGASMELPEGFTLKYGGKYWWKILAVDQYGLESIWSNPSGFICYDLDFQPDPVSPYSYIKEINPAFVWKPATGAVRYQFELSKSLTGEMVFASDQVQSTSIYLPDGLVLGLDTGYRWRVRAFNSEGASSQWSDVRGFIISSSQLQGFQAMKPIALSPVGEIPNFNGVEFKWEPLEGAVDYQIFIYDQSSLSPIYRTHTNKERLLVRDKEFNFASNKQYYWRVRAVNNGGTFSQASDVESFVIADSKASVSLELTSDSCNSFQPLPGCFALPDRAKAYGLKKESKNGSNSSRSPVK